MGTFELILGIILLICAVFLVIAVLMQHGKAKNLSGTIAGGAETFFGKTKGKAIDKMLSTATTAVAVVFVVIVIAMYAIQPDVNYNANVDFGLAGAEGYEGLVTTAAEDEDEHDHETTTEATDSTTTSAEAE